MSTQDLVKQAFALYLKEYGEGYDRFTFVGCVAATLCDDRDAEQLIDTYQQAAAALRKAFPPLDLQTCCPNCASRWIIQRMRGAKVWVAKDWVDPSDGLEHELDHCPECGIELLDSDECNRRIDAESVRCLCGHAAASHANSATECNACSCNVFQLDYLTALVTP